MKWVKKQPTIVVLLALFLLTSCSSENKEVTSTPNFSTSPSPSSEPALSRSDEIQISIEIGCKYVNDGFAYDGSDLIDAEVSFDVAADSFRDAALDYPLAQQFMEGALAASEEVHRWSNGPTLIRAAREASYIGKREADAIVSMYNYCVASDISQSD